MAAICLILYLFELGIRQRRRPALLGVSLSGPGRLA